MYAAAFPVATPCSYIKFATNYTDLTNQVPKQFVSFVKFVANLFLPKPEQFARTRARIVDRVEAVAFAKALMNSGFVQKTAFLDIAPKDH